MEIVYTQNPSPLRWKSSIFLAGPSPRDPETPSWRPEALRLLREAGYQGVVFVPEWETGFQGTDYLTQVEWEQENLEKADIILFWVPRNKTDMLGLTTNVEFGRYITSGKVVFGAPEEAAHVKYLEWLAGESGVSRWMTLKETVQAAVGRLGGVVAERVGGERDIPLHIWNTSSFASWYRGITQGENQLLGAKLLWQFQPPKAGSVFAWVLQVAIWVEAEQRTKYNEFVVARPDISTVVLHGDIPGTGVLDAEVVLVREFRSPAHTGGGFALEFPGGSTKTNKEDPRTIAVHEVHEETGLILSAERLTPLGARQLAGTTLSHQARVFSAKLTPAEMTQAKALKGKVFGVEGDSERTGVEVFSVRDLLANPAADWTTLGMLFQTLFQN